MSRADPLYMWTIYGSPRDFPGKFVARRWRIGGGTPDPVPDDMVFVGETLDSVRAMIPPELICMPRSEGDDPVIVESWI